MRELNLEELGYVAGAGDDCPSGDGGNNIGGVTEPGTLGDDLVQIYEGLVQVTSHIIERVANAL